MKNLLLIFTKNPEKGKVKTRLAKTVGDDHALKIYKLLVEHTAKETANVKADKKVCYATIKEQNDEWSTTVFEKTVQKGDDLGTRMQQAFQEGFDAGYQHIIIIGSDCLDITTALIDQAFEALKTHDTVIGPSEDGGYYLLGMNTLQKELFQQKAWSTSRVLEDTLSDIKKQSLTCFQLPVLNDIDTEEDWNKALKTHTHVHLS